MNTLPSTSCPNCLRVRKSQGFNVIVDESQPLCQSCAKWEADKLYFESEPYQTWLTSVPQGMTIDESMEWMKTHPPPPRV